jgi:hypothetical protein
MPIQPVTMPAPPPNLVAKVAALLILILLWWTAGWGCPNVGLKMHGR